VSGIDSFSLRDLDPGGDAQRRVEVGQRLVEQEDLGIAADRPADGDALTLAARERLGQTVEIRRQLQDFGGVVDRLSISSRENFASRRPKAMLS
jgi:hypothetical protein